MRERKKNRNSNWKAAKNELNERRKRLTLGPTGGVVGTEEAWPWVDWLILIGCDRERQKGLLTLDTLTADGSHCSAMTTTLTLSATLKPLQLNQVEWIKLSVLCPVEYPVFSFDFSGNCCCCRSRRSTTAGRHVQTRRPTGYNWLLPLANETLLRSMTSPG